MKISYKILLIVLLAIVVGGGGFYYWQKNDANHKSPPSLTLGTDSTFLKAYLSAGNYAEYTALDVGAWVTAGYDKTADIDTGVHYYYPDEDISIDNILKSIKPVVGNKVILLFYTPGGESLGAGTTSEGYYSFPDISTFVTGGTTVHGISEAQKTNFRVPANRAFALILSGSVTEFWNNKGANIYDETTPVSDYGTAGLEGVLSDPPNGGWVMIPLKDIAPADVSSVPVSNLNSINDEDFMMLSALRQNNDLISTFFLDGENHFGEVFAQDDLKKIVDQSDGYEILWLRLDSNITFPQIGNPACSDLMDNDGDGKIDFGTGTTNDPGCTNANDTDETDATPGQGSVAFNPAIGANLVAGGGFVRATFNDIDHIDQLDLDYPSFKDSGGRSIERSYTPGPSSSNYIDVGYYEPTLTGTYTLTVSGTVISSGAHITASASFNYSSSTQEIITCTTEPANGGTLVDVGGFIVVTCTTNVVHDLANLSELYLDYPPLYSQFKKADGSLVSGLVLAMGGGVLRIHYPLIPPGNYTFTVTNTGAPAGTPSVNINNTYTVPTSGAPTVSVALDPADGEILDQNGDHIVITFGTSLDNLSLHSTFIDTTTNIPVTTYSATPSLVNDHVLTYTLHSMTTGDHYRLILNVQETGKTAFDITANYTAGTPPPPTEAGLACPEPVGILNGKLKTTGGVIVYRLGPLGGSPALSYDPSGGWASLNGSDHSLTQNKIINPQESNSITFTTVSGISYMTIHYENLGYSGGYDSYYWFKVPLESIKNGTSTVLENNIIKNLDLSSTADDCASFAP